MEGERGRVWAWWHDDGLQMSRVGKVSGGAVGRQAKIAATGGSGFSIAAGAEATDLSRQAAFVRPAPVNMPGLTGMLALQEWQADGLSNGRGQRHGSAVLDLLRELQHSLLDKTGDRQEQAAHEQIARLGRLADQGPAVTDPQLSGMLQAIRLRAKIELLRRGVDTG